MASNKKFLFASESVTQGHPDKLCDLVSEAILDSVITQDPDAKVSCEVCTKTNMVMVLGEAVTKATVDYEHVVREAVKSAGYDDEEKGLDALTTNVILALDEQTPQIAQALIASKVAEDPSTEDQGVVSGYATDETPELMPLSHVLASRLCAQLDKVRKDGTLAWLKPSARAQVVMEYEELPGGALSASRVNAVCITCSQPSSSSVSTADAETALLEHVLHPVLPDNLRDGSTAYHVHLAKDIAANALTSDTGLSGRRSAADTYGGWVAVSSSGIAGKDGLRVTRAGTYAARWAAKSLVAAKLCRRCLVQLSYSPSSPNPVSLHVNSYGSVANGKTDADLVEMLKASFDFRLSSLQKDLGLKVPQFQRLAAYGHFGRPELDSAWERPKPL